MAFDWNAIKASVNMVDLVAKYGQVWRAGAHFETRCRAHDDTKPDLRVWADHAHCFACGWHGDAVDFLKLVEGIDTKTAVERLTGMKLAPAKALPAVRQRNEPAAPQPPTATAELDLARFCSRRSLDPVVLAEFGVRQFRWANRPALRYPTPMGIDRIKYLDGNKPKNGWVKAGGTACWYGLDRIAAAIPENQTDWPRIYIVNGEPSVWAGACNAIPAICSLSGEAGAPAALLLDLRARGVLCVRVVYDLDDAGERGADLMVKGLRLAGIKDAEVIKLPESLGPGGDFDDLCRKYGPDARIVLEKDDFHAHRVIMDRLRVDNRLVGIVQSRDSLRRRMDAPSHPVKGWEILADMEAAIRDKMRGRQNANQ